MSSSSSFFVEELPQILYDQVYTPDQDLYPGKTFSSYPEMKENCPLLEIKAQILEKKGEAYTPYKCSYKRKA